MKKIGLLCLAVVLALGLVGAGFAYWNETLTIEGQADTGEFSVEFVDVFGTGIPQYAEKGWVGNPQEPPLTPTTLTITLSKMYPGASYGLFWLTMKNKGTVPAKLKSVTIENVVDPCGMLPYICAGGSGRIDRAAGGTESFAKKINKYKSKFSGYWHESAGPVSELGTNAEGDGIYDLMLGKVLLPGDTLRLSRPEEEEDENGSLHFLVDRSAPNSIENCTISFDVVFKWVAFNDP